MLKTATQAASEEKKQEIRKQRFEYEMEHFLTRWRPEDSFEASKFETQLISLVRQIHTDAQKPILDQFIALASATAPVNFLGSK